MAAIPENSLLSDENQPRGKPAKDLMDHKSRKTLQSLQLSAKGENLVGKGRDQKNKGKKIQPSGKPVKVFSDSETTRSQKDLITDKRSKSADFSSLEERSTQTDAVLEDVFAESDLAESDREALNLMGGEEASESYWQILAEERRKALNDTLEENEELHKEIDCLREENATLNELTTKASYLSSILQDIISDDDEDGSVDIEKQADGVDIEKDADVVQDDGTIEITLQRFMNSDENTDRIPSKMFKSDDVITSSPIHMSHSISKSEQFGDVTSPLCLDYSPKELNCVVSDSDKEEESGDDNGVVLRANRGSSQINKNRDSDEWVNVELNHDMVTSVDLITSNQLLMKKDEQESTK